MQGLSDQVGMEALISNHGPSFWKHLGLKNQDLLSKTPKK